MEEAVGSEAGATGVRWHEVMPADELWVGDLVGVRVAGRRILLLNVEEQVRAYEDACPHKATPLSEGDLDGDVLTCSTHLWEFNAVTGRGINPETSRLQAFPVRVEEGMIHVGIPEG